MNKNRNYVALAGAVATLAAGIFLGGCGKNDQAANGGTTSSGGGGTSGKSVSVQNIGSDTMVNLAQAWAEAYHAVRGVALPVELVQEGDVDVEYRGCR